METNDIQHILPSFIYPNTNSVVEVVKKEVCKNILCNINKRIEEISFNNIVLERVYIHNNNIHIITGYKPIFLILNEDPSICEDLINNIKKIYHILDKNDDNNFILKISDHLITKDNPYKI